MPIKELESLPKKEDLQREDVASGLGLGQTTHEDGQFTNGVEAIRKITSKKPNSIWAMYIAQIKDGTVVLPPSVLMDAQKQEMPKRVSYRVKDSKAVATALEW